MEKNKDNLIERFIDSVLKLGSKEGIPISVKHNKNLRIVTFLFGNGKIEITYNSILASKVINDYSKFIFKEIEANYPNTTHQ